MFRFPRIREDVRKDDRVAVTIQRSVVRVLPLPNDHLLLR